MFVNDTPSGKCFDLLWWFKYVEILQHKKHTCQCVNKNVLLLFESVCVMQIASVYYYIIVEMLQSAN